MSTASATATPGLAAERVRVRLGSRVVIDDASLSLQPGAFTVLLGPNGAGKTTLVRALAGLLPFEGRVMLNGAPLSSLPPRMRAQSLAYLPQGHVFHWPLAVETVVMLGRLPHGDAFTNTSDADRNAAQQAMQATGIADLAARAVTTLSGGERARVALARALATGAGVLLADEPVLSLDPRHQLAVMALLRERAHRGAAVLAVIHDVAMAARFADRVLLLDGGRVVEDGPPRNTLTPLTLARVFGVEAVMIETADGPEPLVRRPLPRAPL